MKLSYFIAAAIALTATLPAQAADLLFTLTGSATASFILPENPAVQDPVANSIFFINGINGTVNGNPDILDLQFYYNPGIANPTSFGGLLIGSSSSDFINATGPQLYTGPESAPTFAASGPFTLLEFGGPGVYSLTISAVPGAVPEPATWVMLILGFGAIGATVRYRRITAAPSLAA